MADASPQPSTSTTSTMAAASSSSTSTSKSIAVEALLAARPPETDRFTYLTLIEEYLSPEVLPTLHNVLQDASLTQELGWDLVDMLVPMLPASEACLDDVARLGNPREVILKVLDALEHLRPSPRHGGREFESEEDEADEEWEGDDETGAKTRADDATAQAFVALLGMLAILHRRLKTKYPSRFLETTLRTILGAYQPDSPIMTTAVLGLVRSLAARRRPAPPIRRSDSQLSGLSLSKVAPGTATTVADDSGNTISSAIGQVGADHERPGDAAVSVPDPEAEDQVAPSEGGIQQRLLQSFVTFILDAYVNANDMAWAPRLIEYYYPKKLIPGRPTELADFREDSDKIVRDQTVSQLVALALDLGLKYSDSLVKTVSMGPVKRNPLAEVDVVSGGADSISLSTGGVICLLAYWMFASDVFKSDAVVPNMRIFPDHCAILETFFDGNAAAQIVKTPGTIDSIVTIGLWLDHHGLYNGGLSSSSSPSPPESMDFMPYHHLLTLCAVFHPYLAVRNAATMLAGSVLHANPDAEDRLKILQDLLENCMFASLKACAVTWLREEILAAMAVADETATGAEHALFGGSDAVEQLQYAIFPDLLELQSEDDWTALVEYWMQNGPFLMQAANFAYFLFCSDKLKTAVVPPGMGPAIEQRYVEPLLQASTRLRSALGENNEHRCGHDLDESNEGARGVKPLDRLEHIKLDLDVLNNLLSGIKLT